MAKLLTGLVIAAATLALTYATAATLAAALTTAATGRTRADYTAAVERASAKYQAARTECESLNGNEKGICVAEAGAAEKRAKADAEASYKGTIKSRTDARVAAASADYMVAKVMCNAKSGYERDVCVKEAKARQTKMVADARANGKAADPRKYSRGPEYVARRGVMR